MNISSRHNISTLKKRSEIKAVLDNGKRISTRYGLIFLFNDKKSDEKKAAVLLKKNVGSAVKRNYIKRVLRSIIRNNHEKIFNNCNRVVFIYNYKGESTFSLIEEEYLKRLSNN